MTTTKYPTPMPVFELPANAKEGIRLALGVLGHKATLAEARAWCARIWPDMASVRPAWFYSIRKEMARAAAPAGDSLSARINAKHQAAEAAGHDYLTHARAVGELLLQARQERGSRKFAPWLKENVFFSRATAYRLMRLAEGKEAICLTAILQ